MLPDNDAAAASPGRRVSVVIPTTGRATLPAAVASALRQSVPVAEVMVVVDGPVDAVPALPEDPRVRVIPVGEAGGGNAARARGIQESTGEVIALLDDDDVWAPHKIQKQLALLEETLASGAKHVVVGCRMREVGESGEVRRVVPRHLIPAGGSVPEYLFTRREITSPGGVLCSSMLIFDRGLVDEVPLRTDLPRHQDWDWLLAVGARQDTRVTMVPDVLLDYVVQESGQSTSSAKGWMTSWTWVEDHAGALTGSQRAELLLTVTAPIAIRHGEWRASFRIFRTCLALGGGWRSWMFGMAHIPVFALRRLRVDRQVGASTR